MMEYHSHSHNQPSPSPSPSPLQNTQTISSTSTQQITTTHHPYSSSCNYCQQYHTRTTGDYYYYYIYGEDSMSSSPPYESCYNTSTNDYFSTTTTITRTLEEPYRYNYYLLNLITAPDMIAYLSIVSSDDDIYALPLHLQRLIIEAKEELSLNTIEKSAQLRLERVRKLVWTRSGGDLYNLMNQLNELISDEEELLDLLRI